MEHKLFCLELMELSALETKQLEILKLPEEKAATLEKLSIFLKVKWIKVENTTKVISKWMFIKMIWKTGRAEDFLEVTVDQLMLELISAILQKNKKKWEHPVQPLELPTLSTNY